MANIVSIEPLEQSEILFVIRKYHRASKEYMRAMNLLLILAGVLPFIVAFILWISAAGVEVVMEFFFLSLISLISFFIVIAFIFYFLQIFNKYRDAVYKTKSIERCMILEKKEVPYNHTFHFFIDSKVRYSFELPENEYHQYEVGDEINIEYSTYDKEYLGYF